MHTHMDMTQTETHTHKQQKQRAGEKAQLIKYSQCKLEDQSSDLQKPQKPDTGMYMCNPSTSILR